MTKEQIVATALDLIQEKGGLQDVNLREIARRLGCAHTNLYNYFPRYSDLLWSALDEAARRFVEAVMNSSEQGLDAFFMRYLDFYLIHPGWFRLMWLEPMETARSEQSRAHGKAQITRLIDAFLRETARAGRSHLSHVQAEEALHVVHCYLFGEVLIYLSNRGRIREESDFREYVVGNCVRLAISMA